jgi:hypothetical protein
MSCLDYWRHRSRPGSTVIILCLLCWFPSESAYRYQIIISKKFRSAIFTVNWFQVPALLRRAPPLSKVYRTDTRSPIIPVATLLLSIHLICEKTLKLQI